MQDNEFEKQVHRKLTGLTVEGGESVWEKVEKRLDKKDKRRRWFLWIPVGIAALFLAAFVLFEYKPAQLLSGTNSGLSADPGKEKRQAGQAGSAANGNAMGSSSKKISSKRAPAPSGIQLGNNTQESSLEKPDEKFGHKMDRDIAINARSKKLENTFRLKSQIFQDPPSISRQSTEASADLTRSPEAPASLLPQQADIDLKAAIVAAGPFSKEPAATEESLKFAHGPLINLRPAIVHKNFRWGLNLSMARSRLITGNLVNLFPSQAYNSPGSALSTGNGSATVNGPSDVRPGISAGFGAFWKKRLTERFYYTVGLNYNFYSTSMMVGIKKVETLLLRSPSNAADKSLQSYYTSANNQRYVNRYHFIDLPVSFGIDLTRPSKVQLSWELGLAPGRFLASNALHYSAGSSIYYQDNSLFRKPQTGLFTSLPFTFFSNNSYSLQLVPGFGYTASPLLKSNPNNRQHLIASGFSARVLF